MQRDQLGRQRDEAEREQREVAHERHASLSLRPRSRARRTRAVRHSTALVWFRRDLRVHDHPAADRRALASTIASCPVFVLDPRLLGGRFPSAQPRVVPARLPARAARRRCASAAPTCVVREGRPEEELARARARVRRRARVYFASDVSPFARARDRAGGRGAAASEVRRGRAGAVRRRRRRRAEAVLGLHAVLPGVAAAPAPRGPRRAARAALPERARGRARCRAGARSRKRPDPFPPGERAARAALRRAGSPTASTATTSATTASPAAPRQLSPYLHFGCLSRARARGARARSAAAPRVRPPARVARLLRPRAAPPPGATRGASSSARYRELEWDDDEELLDAWREGRTGYPARRRRHAPAARPPAGCTTARG